MVVGGYTNVDVSVVACCDETEKHDLYFLDERLARLTENLEFFQLREKS